MKVMSGAPVAVVSFTQRLFDRRRFLNFTTCKAALQADLKFRLSL